MKNPASLTENQVYANMIFIEADLIRRHRGGIYHMAVIGIDLGTTNSLAAVWKDGKSVLIPNGLGACLTPSVVTEAEGAVWVGTVAREKRLA